MYHQQNKCEKKHDFVFGSERSFVTEQNAHCCPVFFSCFKKPSEARRHSQESNLNVLRGVSEQEMNPIIYDDEAEKTIVDNYVGLRKREIEEQCKDIKEEDVMKCCMNIFRENADGSKYNALLRQIVRENCEEELKIIVDEVKKLSDFIKAIKEREILKEIKTDEIIKGLKEDRIIEVVQEHIATKNVKVDLLEEMKKNEDFEKAKVTMAEIDETLQLMCSRLGKIEKMKNMIQRNKEMFELECFKGKEEAKVALLMNDFLLRVLSVEITTQIYAGAGESLTQNKENVALAGYVQSLYNIEDLSLTDKNIKKWGENPLFKFFQMNFSVSEMAITNLEPSSK